MHDTEGLVILLYISVVGLVGCETFLRKRFAQRTAVFWLWMAWVSG